VNLGRRKARDVGLERSAIIGRDYFCFKEAVGAQS